jgi:hypothetical protein
VKLHTRIVGALMITALLLLTGSDIVCFGRGNGGLEIAERVIVP